MFLSFGILALLQQSPAAGAGAIVAADGSARYRTVQDAINAAPQDTSAERRWVIFVRAGTYHELLYVQREKHFVTLVGEDPLKTVITYGLKAGDTGADGTLIGTFRTPTAYIDADDFTAENLTFENSAGPNGQALALRVDGDRVVFRNCRFLGWQDTILLDRGRQYFEDSLIAGHVDFIFGGATAFFERCRVHALGNGYLTAASTPQDAAHGFVFAHGSITGEPGVKTYLGRPWRAYAAVTFLQTEMSDLVRPEGADSTTGITRSASRPRATPNSARPVPALRARSASAGRARFPPPTPRRSRSTRCSAAPIAGTRAAFRRTRRRSASGIRD
jgi:pectinesterase